MASSSPVPSISGCQLIIASESNAHMASRHIRNCRGTFHGIGLFFALTDSAACKSSFVHGSGSESNGPVEPLGLAKELVKQQTAPCHAKEVRARSSDVASTSDVNRLPNKE
jgi:hypothetical protein